MTNDYQGVLFVSYSSKDEIQVQKLAETLRKQNVPVFTYPFDNIGGASIADGIKDYGRNMALAIAISPNSVEEDWLTQKIEKAVLGQLSESVARVYLLTLVEVPRKQMRKLPYHDLYEVIDLAGENYRSGLDQLVERLRSGPSINRPGLAVPPVPAPFTMTGVFQPARPATDLFTDLKRQIYQGEEIDQKYLYWDVRAALRWQRIAELSGYMTVQMGMNLFAERGGEIVESILSNIQGDACTLINLGVGTGVKDFLLITHLLQRLGTVTYFAVDESFPMIQITMAQIEELLSGSQGRLTAHYIVDDLRNLAKHRKFLDDVDPSQAPRIYCFDNMLSNFKEPTMLDLILDLMRSEDSILLGVEYIADRSDDELKRNYSDRRMKEFLYGPITDATGTEPNWSRDFKYEVSLGGRHRTYSDVPGSKAVVGKVRLNGKYLQLFFSTKYDPNKLEAYLDETDLDVIETFTSHEDPPRYGVYLLRKR